MNLLQHIRAYFQTKASEARIAMSVQRLGQPVPTPTNYLAMSREGYQRNAVVYRCIKLIAMSCAGIKWELYQGDREINSHPLLDLMKNPNPTQGWTAFFDAYISYLAISGNSYIEAVGPGFNRPPMELWTVRPDLMRIIPSTQGYPGSYEFLFGTEKRRWEVDPLTLKSMILHSKTFNPVDIWYGMSPMTAAILGVDQYNHSNKWNLALLQNSASPSGVLKVEATDANPGGSITVEQYARLKNEFYESHTAARNAGKPLLLEGGVSWQSISLSPKEMEWLKGREVSGIDICNVYGVPCMMLGLGQTTYANYKEARQAFFEDTILPLMDHAQFELNRWLTPMFGDNLELRYDKDDIEALVEKREAKFGSLATANWLTVNEKREASGYEPEEGWDVFIIGNQVMESAEEEVEEEEEETDEVVEPPIEENQEQDDANEDGDKGYKTFNLLNQNEKVTAWKRVNRKRKRLEKSFERALAADFEDLAMELEKAAKDKDPRVAEFAMNKVIDDNMEDIEKTLKRYIKFTAKDFADTIFQNAKSVFRLIETKKNEKTWSDWADSFIKKRSGDAITEIAGTTRKKVRKVVQDLVRESILDENELGKPTVNISKELRAKFDSLSAGRARTIARTEVAMASNASTVEAAKSLEIPNMQKEWVSIQDDRTRDGIPDTEANHLDMNGVQVDIDDKFLVPPDASMDGPGDTAGGPGQVINCRCTVIFKSGLK